MIYGEVLDGDVLCSRPHITAPATYLVLNIGSVAWRHGTKMDIWVLDLHTGETKRLVKSPYLPITVWDVIRSEEGA